MITKKLNDNQFEEIYNEFKPKMIGLCYKIVKDHHVSLDITHNVFRKLLNQDEDFYENLDNLRGWLMTVCRNDSIKFFNKKKRIVEFEFNSEIDSPMDESPNAFESLSEFEHNKIMFKIMKKCITKLPERQKQAVNLRFFKNLNYPVIAKKMNTSQGNIGFLLSTAMKTLHKLINSEIKKKKLVL